MGPTPAGETREKIYLFVRRRILAGRPPTVREVQQAFGFKAVQSARHHLEKLVQAGRIVISKALFILVKEGITDRDTFGEKKRRDVATN